MAWREGFATISGLTVFAALFGYLGFSLDNPVMTVIFAVNLGFVGFAFYFFRDPHRVPPDNPLAILSPADGVIIEVSSGEESQFIGDRATRIAIFLSLFDMHINYLPCKGRVTANSIARIRPRPQMKMPALLSGSRLHLADWLLSRSLVIRHGELSAGCELEMKASGDKK